MNERLSCVRSIAPSLLALGLWASHADAAEIRVAPEDAECVAQPGVQYCALQPAFDAAAAGDTVLLAAGTYDLWSETLVVDKSIVVRGEGIGRSVLDGGGAHDGPVLAIAPSAESVHIEGITISNRIRQGSNLRRAAGIDHRGQGLTLIAVEIRDTQGGWGGALSTGAPFIEVMIRGSRFIGNTGLTGAGLDIRNAPETRLEIHDSEFKGNSAVFTGGGLFIRDVGEVLLSRVRLHDNSSGNRGGAMFVAVDAETSTLSLVNTTLERNQSKGTAGIAATGAALSITLKGVLFRDNRSGDPKANVDCSSERPDTFEWLSDSHGACVSSESAKSG